jgi:hypothetical protein
LKCELGQVDDVGRRYGTVLNGGYETSFPSFSSLFPCSSSGPNYEGALYMWHDALLAIYRTILYCPSHTAAMLYEHDIMNNVYNVIFSML